jgi:ABC-type multidrug transport system fused ATPase/permease subunit
MKRYQRIIKIIISTLIVLAVIYCSVYFRPLNRVLEERQLNEFKPREYARYYWDKVLADEAVKSVDASELIDLLRKNPDRAFKQYGKTLGISDVSNFLMKGRAQVNAVFEEFMELMLCNSKDRLYLKTGMVFGNILRDCTGKIKMDDFTKSMDFNNISVEINRIVNIEIIPELKQKVMPDDFVYFEGATGVLKGTTDSIKIELIPIRIILIDDCKQ